MEIKELREKLFAKLAGTGWQDKLRFFIQSSEFDDILLKLMLEVEDGYRITPGLNGIFKPFELCSFDKLKVVFLAQEPYLDPTLNDGLALSNTGSNKSIPMQFYRMKEELLLQVPNTMIKEANLSSWAEQGVLLLNQSFTTRISSPNRHKDIWQPFLYYIMEILAQKDLIFVFIGNHDFDDVEGINLPALPDAYHTKWNSDNLFLKINEKLVDKKLSKIIW